MINLPDKFKTKIINRYGKEGKEWLNSIDNIIRKYKKLFMLKNIRLVDNISINIVLFAESPEFGNIVIKIGAPDETIISEMHTIKYYSTNYFPKCYYYSIEDKVIILERIFPGYNLSILENFEEKIKVFIDISNNLLIPIERVKDKKTFLTFNDIFKSRIEYAYQNKSQYLDILYMIDKANKIYDKIYEMNLPKYILHNDLHDKNILKAEDRWKAIDPHGIIGERVIEVSQLIRNELDNINLDNECEFDEIISLVSKYYKEDKTLILETLYIYIIEKVIFYIKNKENLNRILHNINICKKIFSKIAVR